VYVTNKQSKQSVFTPKTYERDSSRALITANEVSGACSSAV